MRGVIHRGYDGCMTTTITTVAELEALPERVVLLCADGEVRSTWPTGLRAFNGSDISTRAQMALMLPAAIIHDPRVAP